MATQAELQRQLASVDSALAVLESQAASGTLTPVQQAQVERSISDLFAQRAQIVSEQASLTVANNPPNPQVPATEQPLRIDITGVGNLVNDDITTVNVDDAASGVVTVDVTGPVASTVDPQGGQFVFNDQGELIPADSAQAQEILARQSAVQNTAPQPISTYSAVFNPETGLWDVYDLQTGQIVRSGRSQQDAELFAEDANTVGVEEAQSGNVQRAEDFSTAIQTQTQAQINNARAQAALQQQRKQANDGDWRVRLRLAPNADYLYRADSPGPLLQPLKETDGVVFPYTPQIVQAYRAEYSSTNLTHSNYRGFFYQGSQQEDIQINATFTAQDTREANYLLAVITFFKAVTKMFYGQDAQRGTPPPMVFLQGFGQYQFNLNPCVVTQFNYTLPNDVDYIRALSPNINGTNQNNLREGRQALPTDPFSSAVSRIKNLLQPQLGTGLSQYNKPAPRTLGTNSPTYVPTKIDISLILHPMQSRQQVSQEFSLKNYANGSLIEKGFW